ncbi:MAG TPA: RNase A-like domain-containing protein [Terriglobales bacterium]|nr:RNase A-like domain-containing protein [Terriglobales bacterium]
MIARSLRIPALLALAFISLPGCQSPTGGHPTPAGHTESRPDRAASATRNLSVDEAAGGHVLRKHVGRSDEDLRARLEREPNISGASTYEDRVTAERVIGAAIAQNQDRIHRWLDHSGGHANLVLDYDAGGPIGRTLNRGDNQSRPCSHAVVVLRYDPPASFHVLTSYPECRS